VKYSPKTPSVKNPRHAGKKYKGQSTKDKARGKCGSRLCQAFRLCPFLVD
jgi:hypothetical protein